MRYQYKCPKGHEFCVRKSMKESKRVEHCPTCGSIGKRVYSAGAIVVKGSGEYSISYPKNWNSK